MQHTKSTTRFGLFALAAGLGLYAATPVAAAPSCSQRFIAGNITEAVMAFQASRFCSGLPYSSDRAMSRVAELSACSNEAAALISDMMFGNDVKYRLIFESDPEQTACQRAAEISFEGDG